jgi:hypothetical protein
MPNMIPAIRSIISGLFGSKHSIPNNAPATKVANPRTTRVPLLLFILTHDKTESGIADNNPFAMILVSNTDR